MESETETPGPAWYSKCFEYLRNRNRIGPGKVELPDCDFFIVEPRRTLRILRPSLKSDSYYENCSDLGRPESINDKFFSKWTRWPHPSENCRCSFRDSFRMSTTEERIISTEINRIRTSLCEAGETGDNIGEIEKKVATNLENLRDTNVERDEKIWGNEKQEEAIDEEIGDVGILKKNRKDELTAKSKIVRDLESYINDLLDEIMNDTIKFISEAGNSLQRKCRSSENIADKSAEKIVEERRNSETPKIDAFEINFAFPNEKSEMSIFESSPNGYVNPAFEGTTQEPDALHFYLRRQLGSEIILEQLDCIDSGINSVETVELQQEQDQEQDHEPSLEESLLEIIDAKLGRIPLSKSWENLEKSAKDVEQKKEANECEKSDKINNKEDSESGKEDIKSGEEDHESCKEEDKSNKNDSQTNEKHDKKVEEENFSIKLDDNSTRELEEDSTANIGEKDTKTLDEEISQSTENETAETKKTENLEKARNTLDSVDTVDFSPEDFSELEDLVNDQSFERLRLEFRKSTSTPKAKTKRVRVLKEKLMIRLNSPNKSRNGWKKGESLKNSHKHSLELKDCKGNFEVSSTASGQEPNDFVANRRNRKPTIVFIHGFGSSAEIFERQLEYFSNLGYPCIAPDLLGHGLSSAPNKSQDYLFEKLLHDLDLILHHYAFKPEQKCVLVAHNYGCSFATALACKYERSIQQLVLISGGGPTPLAAPSHENTRHCCFRAIVTPFLVCGLGRDILYSAGGRQHPYCGSEPEEQWPSHMKHVLNGMVWPEGDCVFHKRISTPTLLIYGLRDKKVSLVQECQMERTMVKAFLEALPSAGHTPMTDCPHQLNHMIHCFIDLWKNKRWR